MSTVYKALKEKECQLWIVRDEVIRGVVVTEIYTYPTGLKAVNVLFVAGDWIDMWIHLWERVEDWAKANGCTVAEFRGRKGWFRKLDWKEVGIEMVKEI